MPGIPGGHELTKGPISQYIDDVLNDPTGNYSRRAALKEDLLDWDKQPSLADILETNHGLSHHLAQILRENWYNQNGWWPELQPVEPTIRQSFIQAIEVADAVTPVLPIDSYWICARHFEVIITRSKWQVTRLLFTLDAPVNTPARPATDPLADIWMVKPGSLAQVVDSTIPNPTVLVDRPGTRGGKDQVDTVRLKHP